MLDSIASRIRNLTRLFTFRAFDTITEEGRSSERYRRSILTSVSAIASKSLTSIIMLVSVPLTISYLGTERFGLWMTISSLLLILSTFSDLGLSVSYMNKISEANGVDHDRARTYTSNAIFVLFLSGALILFFFLISTPFLNWASIFSLKSPETVLEVKKAIRLLIILFVVGLPFILVEKFQEGNQAGYLSYLWQSIGNVLGLLGLFLVVYFQLGLSALVLVTLGFPVVTRIINFLFQFRVKKKWGWPRFTDINTKIIRELIRPGMIFFFISIFHVIGYNSDNFIISNMLDPSSVAVYGVVQKATLVSLLFWSFTASLWPAYTEALAKKDFFWLKKTIKRTLLINLVFGIGFGFLLTMFGSQLIFMWTGGQLLPSLDLLLGFSFYIIVNGLVGSFAIIYNSSFILKWQLPLIIASSLSSIVLKVYLCEYFGISGVVWGTVISYSIFYLLPSFVIVEKFYIRKLQKESIV